jgi:hypothetical protein
MPQPHNVNETFGPFPASGLMPWDKHEMPGEKRRTPDPPSVDLGLR